MTTTTTATTTATYPTPGAAVGVVDSRHHHHHLMYGGNAGMGSIDAVGGITDTLTATGGYSAQAVPVGQDTLKAAYGYNYSRDREQHLQQQQQQQHQRYSSFGDRGSRLDSPTRMPHMIRSSIYGGGGDYPIENNQSATGTLTAFDPIVGQGSLGASTSIANEPPGSGADVAHSPFEHAQQATTTTNSTSAANTNPNTPTTPINMGEASNSNQRQYTNAHAASSPVPSYLRESYLQANKNDSGIFTDVRSAVDTPIDIVSESSATPGGRQAQQNQSLQQQQLHPQNATGYGTGMPKHPSFSPATPTHGNLPPRHSPIVPSSAAPSYKPQHIPISSSARAVAQQPTYITPPSSPTPIAVNPVYTYTDTTARYAGQQQQSPYRPARYTTLPEGREICVECAMRDQDMADVDVTSPGVWDRESDILYHDLCRQEIEEEEERARAKASSSSSESQHVALKPRDRNRPRARGNRLSEPNLKLWNSMNPREPQARQQTIDLYVKTQTALLEAEALARARALQESRLLESKLKDTYDHLRRSTYDASNGTTAVDENGLRKKTSSHGQKRSLSGPTPISLGPIVVDGTIGNHRQNHGREVTLLENGMIVEQVDVRKEERERRREEKRERERERSRARKSSRGSGGDRNGEAMSMYSAPSPLPHQTDSGFYTASNSSGPALVRERERPMSTSQSSTRAMSVLTASQPLTPPPGSAPGSARPSNTRVHSQTSLVDSQSISSASLRNRGSRFFAFKNWSEAWKSRDSFAPSAVMSLSGSMMDMHVALDRERQAMQARPTSTTVDLGSNAPSIRHSQIFPRRASVSVDRDVPSRIDRPKKKKGLAKIWGMVRGNKNSKTETQRARDVTSVERSEDNAPLAPPPPLSYLVNRTPRERSLSNASRRTSVPAGTMPPSGALPTPTSIRNTWLDDGTVSRPMGGGMLPAHMEESYGHANGYAGNESDTTMTSMQGQGEPEMRQRSQDPSLDLKGPVINTPGSPRPISVYSLHKSLPPLPNEAPATAPGTQSSMLTPIDTPRPVTMFDMNTSSHLNVQNGTDNHNEMLGSPQPYYTQDVRRQSFGGTASRPDLTASGTFPLSAGRGNNRLAVQQDTFGYSPYTEMGTVQMSPSASRSTGKLGLGLGGTDDTLRYEGDKAIGKRRSRFGLSNLLGKVTGTSRGNMNTNPSEARLSVVPPFQPQGPPTSESEQHLDGSPPGTEYGAGNGSSSRSRHNGYITPGQGYGLGTPSRMSVTSRRAIEELVDQDSKFVAYRYPSVDQNIALLR